MFAFRLVGLRNLKKMILFLGKRATRLLVFGGCVGLLLYVVELALAYGIQGFLSLTLNNDQKILHVKALPQLTSKGVLLVILFFGSLRGLLTWANVTCQGTIQENFKYVQRKRIIKWAFNSPSVSATYVNTLFNERVTNGSVVVVNFLVAVINALCAMGLGITLFLMSPILTVILGVFLAVLSVPSRSVGRKLIALGEGLLIEWDRANRRLTMSLKNLLLMQIYGREKVEEEKGVKEITRYVEKQYYFHFLAGFKYIFPQFVGIILICGISMLSAKDKLIESTILISYFYVLLRFLQNIAETSRALSHIRFYRPSFIDLLHWWEEHSHDGLQKRHMVPATLKTFEVNDPLGWSLTNVGFKYPEGHENVFDGLNLQIKPGEFIVVVGRSGAGKSTLLNLLLGGILPDTGKVEALINSGVPEELAPVRASLLKNVGYVGPESFLIEGTIRENILYGLDLEPGEEQVDQALKMAECDFVKKMPQGLNHFISEQGQGLSAGQKQRISLARALLRRPKALFLDEATSNLDFETEAKLIESFAALKNKMTIVAVTHREALTKLADQVVKL